MADRWVTKTVTRLRQGLRTQLSWALLVLAALLQQQTVVIRILCPLLLSKVVAALVATQLPHLLMLVTAVDWAATETANWAAVVLVAILATAVAVPVAAQAAARPVVVAAVVAEHTLKLMVLGMPPEAVAV